MLRILTILALLVLLGSDLSALAAPRLVARVDLSEQRLHLYVDGDWRETWKVSTARRGYVTPLGRYRPTRTHRMWYSRKYHMSPMPYSVFFKGGYAIHGTYETKYLGRRASHGCVRLHPRNARTLYTLVRRYGLRNALIEIVR